MGIEKVLPWLGPAGQLVATGINAFAQGNLNRKTRKWNEKMYKLQREHSLEDWYRTTQYESPENQMALLKAAKLNPNLMYGHGVDFGGNTIRGTNADSWRPEAPDYSGIGNAISSYYDVEVKKAQVDNLKANNSVMIQEALLKAADILNRTADTKTKQFDLGLKESIREYSIDAAREGARKVGIEADIMLNRDEREAAAQAVSIYEAAERILNMRAIRAKTDDERNEIRARIRNLNKDSDLKQLDINLKRLGVQPGDNIALRALGQLLKDAELRGFTEEEKQRARKFSPDKGDTTAPNKMRRLYDPRYR